MGPNTICQHMRKRAAHIERIKVRVFYVLDEGDQCVAFDDESFSGNEGPINLKNVACSGDQYPVICKTTSGEQRLPVVTHKNFEKFIEVMPFTSV